MVLVVPITFSVPNVNETRYHTFEPDFNIHTVLNLGSVHVENVWTEILRTILALQTIESFWIVKSNTKQSTKNSSKNLSLKDFQKSFCDKLETMLSRNKARPLNFC